MESRSIYKDIEQRTRGDIYIGVVGPVRTGKSTLIKRFMDALVIPNMASDYMRERTVDELPQSSGGRTIMTTEPKFIPEEAAVVELESNSKFKVRLIDCVGYIVPSSLGYIEDEMPRMVKTPWYEDEIPFNMAAEIGTQKVISEHSTIGLVVTTDGSISDIPRYEYEEAEERVISELREIKKPFIVLLNCMYPKSSTAAELSRELSAKYSVPVVPVNCLDLTEEEIKEVLAQILFEFPIREIRVDLPAWLLSLPQDHWLKSSVFSAVSEKVRPLKNMRGISGFCADVGGIENINEAHISDINLGTGSARIGVSINNELFYSILAGLTGLPIGTERELMATLSELASVKKRYERLRGALDEVEATGYGIVMPSIDELRLEEPEIMKHGGKYGVRLKASAPSIHMERIKPKYPHAHKTQRTAGNSHPRDGRRAG